MDNNVKVNTKRNPHTIGDYIANNQLNKYFEQKTREEVYEDILHEDFKVDDWHPADITDLLIWMFEQRNRNKVFRDQYNTFVDVLAEKREYRQFNYI